MTSEDTLLEGGLHFDDLNKLRVIEPETAQQTAELKDQCQEFVDKIADFQKLVASFITITNDLSKEVEKQKMKAIGSRNLLKSIAKQRESEKKQLQALISEKKNELERLRVQQQSLQKQELEQTEFIDQFSAT